MLAASLMLSFVLSSYVSVLGTPTQLALSEESADKDKAYPGVVLSDAIPTSYSPDGAAYECTSGSITAATTDPHSPPQARVLNCSLVQQLRIQVAMRNADAFVQDATAYLAAHPYTDAGARYHAWFGASPTLAQHARVVTVFATMNGSSFAAPQNTYYCVPEEQCAGVVTRGAAYTTPWTPGLIFVCPGYFSRNTIAQAGVLVHLKSQWATVGDTGNWAIGEADAKALAISNPFLAVDNGESFALFAANYPPLE